MRMALRHGKLDAICARLKKTSAVDVRATSQNGVSEDASTTRNIDDAGVETKASINNNNEDAVTDLNETPSLCPALGLEGENAATLEAKPMTVSTSPPNTLRQCPTSLAGRRKKRKNSQPRSVLKVEEDFDGDVDDGIEPFAKQFKINSIVSPSPIQEKSIGTKSSNDAQPMHVPLSQIPSNQYFLQQQNEVGVNFLYRPDDQDKLEKNFPLDLSTCKSSGGSFAESSEEKSAGLIVNSFFNKTSHTPSAEGPSTVLCSGEGHPQIQAKVLADYAENTMNELLSIYGFEGGGADKVERGKGLRHKHLQTISPSKSSVPRAESSLPATCVLPHAPSPSPPPADISNGQVLLKDAAISANSLPSYEGTSASSDAKPTNKLSRKEGHLKIRSHSLKSVKQAGILQKHVSSDYAKYIKKFHNGNECEGSHCKDLGYREHYHCLDCNFKVFIKKEEMVRHYKWHKKRDESLQHGFMRYSPLDDCSTKFGSCTHNHRQTHYHCVQAGCDKVYISTSDVQMHSNYHRKDSAIIQEGFQRFRATEDCGTTKCNFYGQRTTHFHCRRPNCNFTFKNKADMEKHKSYHQKDEILGKDGFKKFMKYEHCSYNGCRFSKISNHIHCIRPGCTYVLHSTAQLYSHKRKHERREFENIYRTFKQAQRNPGLQSQSSTQAVSTIKSCGTQLVSTVATLPLNVQLASPSLITSLPVQAIGEPMVARGVVSGQAVRPIALPVTIAAASAPVLPHPVLTSPPVRSAVFSPALSQAVSDAAAVSMPMHAKTENEDTKSVSNSCTTATFTALKVKLETRSDSGSDAEEDGAAIKGEDASTPSLLEESVSDLKKTNLQDSLNVPIPGKTNLQDSLNVPILGETNLQDSLNVLIPGEINSIETDQEQGNGDQVIGKTSSDGSVCAEARGNKSPPLQPVQPKVRKIGAPEKRDRDESWKNYLIRYTANDPCNSRCALLYKDHYHCKISGCQVLFKSKDGVREHAKFHDLQDRVTPLMYNKYDSQQPCPETCQYNLKDTHYHCKWTGCTHAIPETGSTFGRLEHYRIHEFAKAAAGKNCRMPSSLNSSAEDALAQRRRGRPPKYPRMDVPLVPKVELSETEIKESSAVTANMETLEGKCQVINGFRRFEAGEPCPDEQCMYFMQVHYHCGRPRCHTATDRVDVLNLHAKDFHSFVNILEHFEFFDRNVNCRRVHCHNNGTNRHYHCTRPRCDYSFVRHSTMTQHDRKHMSGSSSGSRTVTATLATPRLTPIQLLRHPDGQTYIPIVSALDPQNKNIVKASGTFYPLSTVPGLPATAVTLAPAPLAVATSGVQQLGTSSLAFTIPANLVTATIPVMAQTLTTSSPSSSIVPVLAAGSVVTTAGAVASMNNPPLTVLLQQKCGKEASQPSWTSMRNNMHYSLQASCGRPFCKLKKKDHFHCLECNQAFSDPGRLRGHISKHGVRFRKLVHEMRAIKPLPLTAVTTLQSSGEVGLDLSTTKGKQDPAIGASTAAPSENKTDSSNTGEEQETGEETEDSVIPLSFDSPAPSLRWETSSPAGAVFDASEERPLVIDEEINEYSDDSSWLANEGVDRREDSREHESASEPESPVDNSVDGTDTSAATSPAASRRSVRRRTSTKHEDYMSGADSALARQMKLKLNAPIPSTAPRVNKQIPDGFIRFHCSSDCGHQRCAYRQTVTHYHCLRPECGYGFSDKSRIIQHRVRHERIDQLMGEDFQQFRATVSCSHPNCVFAEKSSHFHCRKCSFMCADSSKVLAHRKYHAKLDNINNNGFQKFTGSEDCHVPSCTYYCKQTHYHCMYTGCNHAVLGPAQMAPHKLKHACREM